MADAQVQDAQTKSRRKLKSFFVKPKYQMKYAWQQVLGGIVFFTVTAAFVHKKLAMVEILMAESRVMDIATQVQINQLYADIATIFMAGFAGYIVYSCMLILLLSHRVSGPMIAIVDTIQQLIAGNYGYRRPLRERDELIPIQEHLHDLSQVLKAREKAAAEPDPAGQSEE